MWRPYGPEVPWNWRPSQIPVLVPAPGLIWRNDDTAVVLESIRAYSDMTEFTLVIMRRAAEPPEGMTNGAQLAASIRIPRSHLSMHHAPRSHGVPPDFLRVGVLLADGRRATNLDDPPASADLVLVDGGGHGGRNGEEQRLRLWPLPPPGLLELVLEWPAFGMTELHVPLDADTIRAAAARAVRLWP